MRTPTPILPAARLGAAVLLVLGVAALTARGVGPVPGWWPYHHTQLLPLYRGGQPTLDLNPFDPGFGLGPHPLGQDEVGHDYLALVLRGLERSLTVCLVATAVALVVGVTVGVLAGYLRGWVDTALSRVTEVAFTLPALVIAAVLARYTTGVADRWFFDPALMLGVVIGLLTWMTMARVVRAQALQVRASAFVEASTALGAGSWFVLTRHVVPHLLGPVLATAALVAGNAVLLESGLSYLGFGVQSPDTSLGQLVDRHQGRVGAQPWLLVAPGLLLLTLVLAVHAIGEGLAPLAAPRAVVRRRGART